MAKIAIIDDAAADLKMMESILKSASHTVTAHNDPTGVENSIGADKPDLVMLDIVMPQRNGYEVLRALKRNPATKDVPVILVSSKAEDTDVRWGLRQGAAAYITKPYTPEGVLTTVREHL